jgi:hypothetical protein
MAGEGQLGPSPLVAQTEEREGVPARPQVTVDRTGDDTPCS